MLDDPLGFTVQMIFVLAAGMYPVGFMFGVCSDCCCPECNYCSSAYANPPNPTGVTLTFGDQEIFVDADDFGFRQNLGDLLPLSLATFMCNGTEYELRLNMFSAVSNLTADSCGCLQHQIVQRAVMQVLEDGAHLIEDNFELWDSESNDQTFTLDLCNDETRQRTFGSRNSSEYPDYYDAWPYPVECHPEELDGATIGVEFHFDGFVCECGACCRESECEPNVTEFWCEDESWGNTVGTWQGVGTDCDPDPCSE